MAWPSAKIGVSRWLGFADGLAVGKNRLCLWPVFDDGWAVCKISLPMGLWFADGKQAVSGSDRLHIT
jgi:hypothetical protein